MKKILHTKMTDRLKGFSFLEVIVSIFIFSLVISTATAVFAKVVLSYRRSKEIQRDLESAQQAMNSIAKSLRTSTVTECWPGGGACVLGTQYTSIVVYDYSQDACMVYGINTPNYFLYQKSDSTISNITSCTNASMGGAAVKKLTEDYKVSGGLNVVKSSPAATVGKVTLILNVCSISAGSCDATKDKASVQTTVSLRDYQESGL